MAASVIIATRDKASYLDLTLAALERQLFPSDKWEAVIADDASRDDTESILSKYEMRGKFNLVCIRAQAARGLKSAREHAIQFAQGNVLVFLGEDCLTAPDFLTRHLRHHLKDDQVIIGDCSRLIHTHLFSPNDFVMNGTSARLAFVEKDLDAPEKLRPFILNSGCSGQENLNNSVEWICENSVNASVPKAIIISLNPQQSNAICFEPRAVTLRQLSSHTPLL